jgi:hypothetical protein
MPSELPPDLLSLVAIGIVALALKVVGVRGERRMVSSLPANTSGGSPVMLTRRERVLIVMFCCFVATVIAWLSAA